MKPGTILVGTDFSPASELAVRRAAALAARFGAELRLIHALPPARWLSGILGSRSAWTRQVRAQASAMLKTQAERLAVENIIEVSTGLLEDRASLAIGAAVKQFEPDLVIVGARGESVLKGEQPGLGHTAATVLAATKKPLLLVRRHDIELPGKVLAALDLSAPSRRVVRWADAMAGKGALTVLHVFEAPFADRLRSYGISRKAIDVYAGNQQQESEQALQALLNSADIDRRTMRLAVRGEAIRVISAHLKKHRIDTLVLGKHTRRKRDAAQPHGSVCNHLAQFAPTDVLVIP
jgi:universal stress protein E